MVRRVWLAWDKVRADPQKRKKVWLTWDFLTQNRFYEDTLNLALGQMGKQLKHISFSYLCICICVFVIGMLIKCIQICQNGSDHVSWCAMCINTGYLTLMFLVKVDSHPPPPLRNILDNNRFLLPFIKVHPVLRKGFVNICNLKVYEKLYEYNILAS